MTKTHPLRKRPKQMPLKLRAGNKTGVRTQFAALCYRIKNNKVQICLITSRGTGRWILPKGWPMHKQTPAKAAATEAWEEAGLTGKAIDQCLGVYTYTKPIKGTPTAIITLIYPVHIRNAHSTWPEAHQRRRKWLSPTKAARKVAEPALAQILKDFSPAMIKT